jgi:hypothetical protein
MRMTRYNWRHRLQALRVPSQIVACLCLWPLLLSAKNDASEPTVEIKCLVPEANIADLSKRLDLQSKKSMKRVVCFFDTDSLSLFQHVPKVILRSRYDSVHGADTTVKIRDSEVQGQTSNANSMRSSGRRRSCLALLRIMTKRRTK